MLKSKVLMAVAAVMVTAGTIFAQTDITAKFTDAIFKAAVYEKIGKSAPAAILDTDVDTITSFSVGRKNILSLNGIEYFTALTHLYCYSNQLTTLDLSKNTALTYLDCSPNQLTSIDVSGCTALTTLNCYNNKLTTLDVSKNTALERLSCSGNKLTTLDVSKNTALEYLDCSQNQLTILDVSKNTALTDLGCSRNQLTSIDVSKNTKLDTLFCSYNQLTSIDVSKNTVLKFLLCDKNYLTSEYKIIGLNKTLTTLSFGSQYEITDTTDIASCFYDLIFLTKIRTLIGKDTGGAIYITDVNTIDSLFLRRTNPSAVLLRDADAITSLSGIEFFVSLQYLDVSGNNLTALDLLTLTDLKYLDVSGNQLNDITLTNPILEHLDVSGNQLTELDLLTLTDLKYLDVSGNNLTALDLLTLTDLKYLDVSDNRFVSIKDIKNLENTQVDLKEFELGEQNTAIHKSAKKAATAISFVGIRNGQINLYLKAGNYTVELYNVQGRLVAKANVTATNGVNATGVMTNTLSKGMFILNVKREGTMVLRQKVAVK